MIDSAASIYKVNISNFLESQNTKQLFKFLESMEVSEVKSVKLLTEIKNIYVKRLLNNVNYHCKLIAETDYAKTLNVEFEQTKWIREPELVKWNPGSSLDEHMDGPGRIPPPDLTIGGLVYLNDDYDGGELTFPEYGVTIKPVAGDLVFFPCHFLHKVETITGDKYRYTLPLFYTFKCKEINNV